MYTHIVLLEDQSLLISRTCMEWLASVWLYNGQGFLSVFLLTPADCLLSFSSAWMKSFYFIDMEGICYFDYIFVTIFTSGFSLYLLCSNELRESSINHHLYFKNVLVTVCLGLRSDWKLSLSLQSVLTLAAP